MARRVPSRQRLVRPGLRANKKTRKKQRRNEATKAIQAKVEKENRKLKSNQKQKQPCQDWAPSQRADRNKVATLKERTGDSRRSDGGENRLQLAGLHVGLKKQKAEATTAKKEHQFSKKKKNQKN